MCRTSITGFSDCLFALWQRLRGRGRRSSTDPATHSDQPQVDNTPIDEPRPDQCRPEQPQADNPKLNNKPKSSDQTPPEKSPDQPLVQPSVQPEMGDSVSEQFCTPCGGFGNRVFAEVYCVDCREYLCGECTKYHKVLTVTKDHELLSVDEINETPPTSTKDRPTQVCEQHDDEVVKYYCPVHDYVGCHVCITLNHRTCKGVVYIQEVSKDILDSKEYKEFDVRMTEINQKADNLTDELEQNAASVDSCTEKAVDVIKEVRKKVETALEKLEEELKKQAKEMGRTEGGKMSQVSDKVRTVRSEILALTKQIETFKVNTENSNLYMLMKKLKSDAIEKLENKLKELEGMKAIRLFNFHPNTELLEMLGEAGGLGQMRLRIQKLEHFTDINVRSKNDSSECSITGSAMMRNCRLVVADYSNHKIKLIDIKKNKLLSEFELSSAPWDCTDISDTEVAVSLPNEKKIVLVKTDPELMLRREIQVNGICRGVAHDEDKLIVTFPEDNDIQFMDMDGVVSQTISLAENGQPLFDNPSYVCFQPETDLIYVTNWANNTVVCLKTDGTVVKIFRDKNLQCPEQVVVDSIGLVYFCGCLSHNIYQLTADCELMQIILTDGLRNPYSINYSNKTDRFYVGMKGTDVVKVYRAL